MKAASMGTLIPLAALALALGCGSESAELATGPAAPEFQAAADEPPRYSAWSAPANLGPVVNTPDVDNDVSVSRDGLSLYFGSNRPGGFGGFDIYVARRSRVDQPWGAPQNLGPTVNTAANEQGPALTRDGHRLFLFSDRPGGVGGSDLYVSRRRGSDELGWEAPANLGSGVNSASNEGLPHYFEDPVSGVATLYFNSNRPGYCGGTDIFAASLQPDGTFGGTVHVPELCSPLRDAGTAIRRDGLEMILSSDRAGTLGGFDLWVSTRASTGDPWPRL